MINALIGKIIGDEDYKSAKVRQRCGESAGLVGLICNFTLFAMKLVIGLLSGSVAVAADAFNNLTDGVSSLISILGFRISGKEPDQKHPFGYGRTEYVAGLMVSIIILVVGLEFLKTSISRILTPEPIDFSVLMLVLLLLSIGVKLLMSRFYVKMGIMIESPVLMASGQDSRNDVITTFVVILGMLTGMLTPFPVDGYAGLVVAIFILWSGIGSIRDALSPILGAPADPTLAEKIETIVCSYSYILGVHDMIIHDYGASRILATLHAEVPADADMIAVHEEIDAAEKRVLEETDVMLVIHMDPMPTNNAQWSELNKRLRACLRAQDPSLSMHDFHILEHETHIDLIFDVIVPYQYKDKEKEVLAARMEQLMQNVDARYHTRITFDYEM